MRRLLLVLILCGAAAGCARSLEKDVHFNYTTVPSDRRGPLASVRPLNIKFEKFIDARADKELMGYKKSSGGMETGRIFSEQPLPAILQASLTDMLKKNGHKIKGSKPDIVLSGVLTEFAMDVRTIPMALEYTATIAFVMAVEDGRRHLLYNHEYRASYREKSPAMASVNVNQEISKAIDQLMFQVISDRQLYDVLTNQPQEAPRSHFLKRMKWPLSHSHS